MKNKPSRCRALLISLICVALTASCAGEGPLVPEANTGVDLGRAARVAGVYDLDASVMSAPAFHDLTGFRYTGVIVLELNPKIPNGLFATVEQLRFVSPDQMWDQPIAVSSATAFVYERGVVIEIHSASHIVWRGSGVAESVRIRGTWEGDNATGSFTAERRTTN